MRSLCKDNKKPTLQALAGTQEKGCDFLPVDCMTDCRDFFELTTGKSSLPQDKSQRVYVLCHREAQLVGRLRWTILVPTPSMVADCLTKVMLAKQLLAVLTTGMVESKNEEKHPLEARRPPSQHDFIEAELEEGDQKWLSALVTVKDIKEIQHTTSMPMSSSWTMRPSWMLVTVLYMAAQVRAHQEQCQDNENVSQEPEGNLPRAQSVILSVMIILLGGLCAAVRYLWKGIKNLRDVLEHQADNVVRPLVHRMLVVENTMDDFNDHAMSSLEQLQCHARAVDEDINTLFRAVRRGAPPHPDDCIIKAEDSFGRQQNTQQGTRRTSSWQCVYWTVTRRGDLSRDRLSGESFKVERWRYAKRLRAGRGHSRSRGAARKSPRSCSVEAQPPHREQQPADLPGATNDGLSQWTRPIRHRG